MAASLALFVMAGVSGKVAIGSSITDDLLLTPPSSEGSDGDDPVAAVGGQHAPAIKVAHADHLLLTPLSEGSDRPAVARDPTSSQLSPLPFEASDTSQRPHQPSAASSGASGLSGRGKHTRTDKMQKRSKWKPWVMQHVGRIAELLTTNSCGPKCQGCDVGSFATKRLAETCAIESFGEAALRGVCCHNLIYPR